MRTQTAATNPWGETIDDGWKDMVVSSAPPPPPREAMEPVARNRPLPTDFNTWQEHGAPRKSSAVVEPPIDEPNFTAADRRLWLVAGTLMGLAVLVLAVLGTLTFGGSSSTPQTSAAADVPRAADVTRAVEPSRAPAVVANKSSNPRILKAASHSNRGRHHKRVATR